LAGGGEELTRLRLLASGFSMVVLAGLPVLAARPAAASPIGACTESVGTVVAVDFGHWGGPIVRGCGVNQSSGFALLRAGGFSTAFDQHDGPGSICRIGSAQFDNDALHPTASEDRCVVTPPTTAYWSYWLAAKGQSTWTYSQYGATADQPKAGEVQLWEFGGTDVSGSTGRPTVSPQSLRATNPKPTGVPTTARPTKTKQPTSTPSASKSPDAARKTPSPRTSASATHHPTPHRSAPARGHRVTPKPSTATLAPSATASSNSASPRVVDAVPAAARRTSHGSATGLLIGAVLALLLGGGAGWVAWRRRAQRQ
jgi:hypothetical protein